MSTRLKHDFQQFTRRIFSCARAGTLEFEVLLEVREIVVSEAVQTAAISGGERPHLLLNPHFINTFCSRDEHLYLLVAHELLHVVLAHTRWYPQQNMQLAIALDAVINAQLSRQYYPFGEQWHGFFEAVNPAPDDFPSLLLRPPSGWFHDPIYPDVGPAGTSTILKRLYPPQNNPVDIEPLYEEILDLFRQEAEESDNSNTNESHPEAHHLPPNSPFGGPPATSSPQGSPEAQQNRPYSSSGSTANTPTLLGNHHELEAADPNPGSTPLPGQQPLLAGRGDSSGGFSRRGSPVAQQVVKPAPVSPHVRRAFEHILRRYVLRLPAGMYGGSSLLHENTGSGFTPNPYDRYLPARQSFDSPLLLYMQYGDVLVRDAENGLLHVFLDVSGSMAPYIAHLLTLICPYVAKRQWILYQFSTEIEPLSTDDLRQGVLLTTKGTDINAVIRYALEINPPVRRFMVITDGDTGAINAELAVMLRESGSKMITVLPHKGEQTHLYEASYRLFELPAFEE